MARSYLFFSPARLPLGPAELSTETVRAFTDADTVRMALDAHLPELAWAVAPEGALAEGTVTWGGTPYEFSVRPHERQELIVSLRCSRRVDSETFVQWLCDAAGWVAFDEQARLFQPHRPPVAAGRG